MLAKHSCPDRKPQQQLTLCAVSLSKNAPESDSGQQEPRPPKDTFTRELASVRTSSNNVNCSKSRRYPTATRRVERLKQSWCESEAALSSRAVSTYMRTPVRHVSPLQFGHTDWLPELYLPTKLAGCGKGRPMRAHNL